MLTLLGVWSYTTVPASIFPAMSFARVDVVADAGDLPPDRVRTAVALPLERAFNGLPSMTRVLSTSAQGNAELIVEFDPSTDVQSDLQHVLQAVASTRGDLPAGVNVDATVINPNSEPVLSYAFSSNEMSQTILSEMVQQSLEPQFYGTPGLARMLVVGGRPREFEVALDPAALSAHGLQVGDVTKALADANTVVSPGIASDHETRNVLVLDSRITDAAGLGNVVVAAPGKEVVPLHALGRVRLTVAPETNQASFDAHHATMLNFYALPGADTVKLADAVNARMTALQRRLPSGVGVAKYWDQTTLVRESQNSLRDAIALGAALAICVIFIFLRSWRMTLVAALIIPVAIALVIFAIGRFGQTLNLMSVGGLAVAVGLIIDDAIVVIENVARHFHENPGRPRRENVIAAMRELVAPMTASTLTTVVVFIPLGLLTGVSGFFFRALAVTLATSLIVSLLLAIFVTPLIAEKLVSTSDDHDRGDFMHPVGERYERLLRWALEHRRSVYAASAAVLVVTAVLLTHLPSDFLPALDEGQFEIKYTMPVGATLAASDRAATDLERVALADPAVAAVGRFSGIDTNGFSPTPPRTGTVRITLKPVGQRDSYDAISDRMRDAMTKAVPAAQLDFHQILEDMINDISGAPSPVEVTLIGPDQAKLIEVASGLADDFSKVPGVTDVFSGVQYDDPATRIAPNGARLAALGLQATDVADALSAGAQGSVATTVPGALAGVPVRVRLATDPSADAQSRLIPTALGTVPLGSIATLTPDRASSDIVDQNGVRVMMMTANYSGSLSSAISGIREVLAKHPLPAGYSYTLGGAYEAQQQSFKQFALVIAIAIILVYFVMLSTFASLRLPLVILTAIPLALIGVALGLFVTGTPFNVSSFMGLLLLVGLIVKNGILLIDVANRRRLEGASVLDALVAAGRLRLRPILMTTFAAIGGLLPLALGLGAGSEMEKPLAIAVIGGLSTATAFTLGVIPVLYAGFTAKEAR